MGLRYSEWISKISEPEMVTGPEFEDLVTGTVYRELERRRGEVEGVVEEVGEGNVVVNEILWGGRFYGVPRAVYRVLGFVPRTGYVKIESRVRPGETTAEVKYGKLKWPEGEGLLILGDTVASGSTLRTFLSLIPNPEEIILLLFTIGTEEGVEHGLSGFEGEVLDVVYLPFPFGLNPKNRTDMPVILDTLPEEMREKLLERSTEEILRVQCVIGDFSDSMTDIPSFFAEWFAILSQMYAYLDWVGDERGKGIVERRGRRVVKGLKKWFSRPERACAEALTRRQRLKGYEREFRPEEVVLDVVEMGRRLGEEDWDEFTAIP